MIVRQATEADADALCGVLNPIIAAGGTTAHQRPFDADRMIRHYIAPPRGLSCAVAEADGRTLGFQALERTDPDWPGEDALPEGWAVIASFVAAEGRGHGVGRALFAETLARATAAGIVAIDATIRADNALGLQFYAGLGFTDYGVIRNVPLRDGTRVDRVRRAFHIAAQRA